MTKVLGRRGSEQMDIIFEILSWLIPLRDDRMRQWERIGCFVALSFGAVALAIGGLWYAGSY
jgi:hypothetical protein